MTIAPYTWLLLAGIIISFLFWKRRARQDRRLIFIYGAALVGAFFGAKIVYLFAEGWQHFGAPDMWLQLAAGKSILGALLGGYIFVELRRAGLLRGQHFHLYLIGYGLFRFAHEFVRATPKIGGPFSGYHFAALIVAGFGAICFWRRQNGKLTTENEIRVGSTSAPKFANIAAPTP